MMILSSVLGKKSLSWQDLKIKKKKALVAFCLPVDPKLNLPPINIHKSLLNITVLSLAGLTLSPSSRVSPQYPLSVLDL